MDCGEIVCAGGVGRGEFAFLKFDSGARRQAKINLAEVAKNEREKSRFNYDDLHK